jgi:hypothetical protein
MADDFQTTRDLFQQDDAERFFKQCAGKRYRPSNGTEGEMFKDMFCYDCARCNAGDPDKDPCDIEMRTFFLEVDDADYPQEWQYGPNGQPICTAFEEAANHVR